MRRNSPVVAAPLAALGLMLASLPVNAAPLHSERTITIADLNNPCTPGHDSIDGVLNINSILDRGSDGSLRLLVSARGSGSDANNLFYRFLASGTVIFTDPLPARFNLSVRLQPSNTPASEARLGLTLLIDERGRLTDLGQSGLQCGSPA